MKESAMFCKYGLIVIGAGNGGLMAACRAARMGLKPLALEACVERQEEQDSN